MQVKIALAVIFAASVALSSSVAYAVTIEVGYPYSSLFDVTFKRIYPMFKEAHPDIEVKFRASYDNYEDASNTILRESVADKLPDVTFQGLNRQAMFVEKGIAKSLEPFIAKEANFAKEGYHKAMLELGTFGGQVYGLPFSVSLPVGFYNMDAMNKAGVKTLPTTWDEVVDSCDNKKATTKGATITVAAAIMGPYSLPSMSDLNILSPNGGVIRSRSPVMTTRGQ